jgi:hypothetical protein
MSGDHNMNQTDSGWRKRQIALNKKAENARELGLVAQPEQPEVQRLIALVRAQQITIDKLEMALAQPAPVQEPVAVKRMKVWVEFLKRQSDNGQHMNIPSGLNAGACWDFAIELEQFINTHPPQRTWVELTQEQMNELWANSGNIAGYHGLTFENIRAVSAKLKELNT